MAGIFGPYQLLQRVAEGGMAQVFVAKKNGALGWSKQVALKRILPPFADRIEFRQLFLREAQLLSKLSHPNIVQIYDCCDIDDFVCIEQELVMGRDLAEIQHRLENPLPECVLIWLLYQVAGALDYLHSQAYKILHCDISPQNMVITYEGYIKLVDFGIAVELHSTSLQRPKFGKPRYMAPETMDHGIIDERSEVYGLGVSLLEATSVQRCRFGKDHQRVFETLRDLHVRSSWVELLSKMVVPDAKARVQNMKDIRRYCLGLLSDMNVELSQMDATMRDLMQALYPTEQERAFTHLTKTLAFKTHPKELRPWRLKKKFLMSLAAALMLCLWPLEVKLDPPLPSPLNLRSKSVASEVAERIKPNRLGRLRIDAFPWASAYVNGKYMGETPVNNIELPAGEYRIDLIGQDARLMNKRISLRPGRHLDVFERLQ